MSNHEKQITSKLSQCSKKCQQKKKIKNVPWSYAHSHDFHHLFLWAQQYMYNSMINRIPQSSLIILTRYAKKLDPSFKFISYILVQK